MLTNPEAASAAITRYQAQIAQVIPAADADLRAAIISAITFGTMVSRHLSSPTNSPAPTPRRYQAAATCCCRTVLASCGRGR
jgi:hypothetical protein